MAYVNCPKCADQSYFNLASYKGPYRCMKCKEVFNITIENSEVQSTEPINPKDTGKLNLIKTYYKK